MNLLHRIGRALRRVFPRTGLYAQALAFNLFLTVFPLLLLAVSLLAGSHGASTALEELLRDRWMLPASSRDVIFPYLHAHNVNPGRWLIIGLIGTILAGTQCMSVLLESFRMMEGADRRPFWRNSLQALGLLCLALVPALAEIVFTVFGRLVRAWLTKHLGLPGFVAVFWVVFAAVTAWLFAVLILALLYRAGQPCIRHFREGLPGALLATGFWVLANVLFGAYMSRTPYGPVYGGLAAIIGLLVWLQLSTMVVFVGAAFNAESLGVPPLK
ncbi:MAG TPA: YihY/virulence factor BrkB family protein [Candidatus Acidoferrales bacterium]|nr:YihY/virulence factor BrkB family protein [Candidatus Acidoferrales bacterium]